MIAALFVATDGVYFGRPDVDPWDKTRDARTYTGGRAVVAHPPCSRWCQLAHINQKRYGHRVGDDDGCFAFALSAVLSCSGVLEHPARSYAWPAFRLPVPRSGSWQRHGDVFVTEVSQGAYGHPARKLTWLLYCGVRPPPPLDWSARAPSAQVSFCKNHGNSPLPRLSKKAAAATPPRFADLLISIAKRAKGPACYACNDSGSTYTGPGDWGSGYAADFWPCEHCNGTGRGLTLDECLSQSSPSSP